VKFQSRGGAGGRATKADQGALPLCVDFDGTLIHTDSLHEALMVASRDLPAVFKAVTRLGEGKAAFKQSVYGIADLHAAHLPYNFQLIEFLRREHARGRKLFLVTAADQGIAEAVATELGLFSEVICSDGVRNLRGKAKADVLADRFGVKGFCYAGNDVTDLEVWKVAAAASW
jgi:FMN phosphatase YigB (HAD superfamily)